MRSCSEELGVSGRYLSTSARRPAAAQLAPPAAPGRGRQTEGAEATLLLSQVSGASGFFAQVQISPGLCLRNGGQKMELTSIRDRWAWTHDALGADASQVLGGRGLHTGRLQPVCPGPAVPGVGTPEQVTGSRGAQECGRVQPAGRPRFSGHAVGVSLGGCVLLLFSFGGPAEVLARLPRARSWVQRGPAPGRRGAGADPAPEGLRPLSLPCVGIRSHRNSVGGMVSGHRPQSSRPGCGCGSSTPRFSSSCSSLGTRPPGRPALPQLLSWLLPPKFTDSGSERPRAPPALPPALPAGPQALHQEGIPPCVCPALTTV